MYPFVYRAARKLWREFEFDLIDAHFAYPEGVVAASLGERFSRPVVVTGRGEDIGLFPRLPVIGRQIGRLVTKETELIAVSRPIKEAMIRHGAHSSRVTLIPNGVDCERFTPTDSKRAREQLGLDVDRPIVLSVGYRLERKGFHILIDAVGKLRERFPNILVVIVGGPARWGLDYTAQIEQRIRDNDVADSVFLAGPRHPDDLPLWYSAADVMALLSAHEGSPNVVMESLAGGLPVVATRVGGIPELLSDDRLGILLPERSHSAAATGIESALSRNWDREAIRQTIVKQHGWQRCALKVDEVFDRALARYSAAAQH
jgi:glycosyltransferase involved in cell wall biosynthesis